MGVIRFLLAVAVLSAHSWPILGLPLIRADFAVELFFMISGFYMTLVLNTKYPATRQGLSDFWSNRALRLFPTYWIVLAGTAAIALLALGGLLPPLERAWAPWANGDHLSQLNWQSGLAMVVTNLGLFGQDVLMFTGVAPHGGLYFTPDFHTANLPSYTYLLVPQAWSISIELMFYLLAPFLLRRKLRWLAGLAVASVLVRLGLAMNGLYQDPWSYRLFPNELLFFMLGAIACRLAIIDRRLAWPRWAGPAAFGAMVALVAGHGFLVSLAGAVVGPRLAAAGAAAAAFVALATGMAAIFEWTKRSAWDRLIGDLSYPIYISHVGLLLLVRSLAQWSALSWLTAMGSPWFALLVVGVSLGLVFGIERPIDRIRQRRLQHPVVVAPRVGQLQL